MSSFSCVRRNTLRYCDLRILRVILLMRPAQYASLLRPTYTTRDPSHGSGAIRFAIATYVCYACSSSCVRNNTLRYCDLRMLRLLILVRPAQYASLLRPTYVTPAPPHASGAIRFAIAPHDHYVCSTPQLRILRIVERLRFYRGASARAENGDVEARSWLGVFRLHVSEGDAPSDTKTVSA